MKPGILVFHVKEQDARKSLVTLLRQWLPEQSWRDVKRLVQTRRVQINGNLCLDEGRRLTAGEVVRVLQHSQAPPPREDDVKIHFLDNHLVVVEKPAGLTTLRHSEELDWPARRKDRQPTLDELLPRVLARRRSGGPPARGKLPRVRAVHRLDRETSGLMVFARSAEAERHLIQQFRRHTIHRKYIAVIHGHIQAQRIESNLVRDRGDGRRGSTNKPQLGQRAVTHIRPVERLGDYSLIECQLETGRTHQIRIHLSEAGHFVCGDKVYRQPLFKPPLPDNSGAPRVALHAAELGFDHPVTSEPLHFHMPLPRDLKEFIERLRREAGKRGAGECVSG
jgi:23S rRNA pseudouridine1911/1915/1917 synthase